ncbi:methyltransferase domain-containing protein [Nocardioides sp. ChNu-153]|uniref:class I SAM-dependent methyltransferase n=1 Tax=unclassified Nocardioides TaxID=2615069 RepID=UPI0024056DCE|nr:MULTISPECIES: class I SAM-dependent methyltransferase [unclassified Nocardioides]MDF9715959.1 class I SAM-dependent methyltransferase [Nocardioides sp. ChNu-99]MDN7122952.1 methyltransferase domain-containing protein [Nocardioides sp. ChNu-153]
MRQQTIPARIRWGVDVMDVQPGDQLLEVGCGPGAAAELVCSRLETGKLFAIDRSESGVDRTKRRCAAYVDAGRLTVRQIDLATLRVPVKRLHKAFAFNVNLFWVRGAADEVALLHEKLLPGGKLFLFYEATRPEGKQRIVESASRALTEGGFRVSVVQNPQQGSVGIVGQRVTAQI